MSAMVDDQTQKAIATTAIAMVIGAAIGFAVADQVGGDPAIGILVGAFAGGGVALLADAYSRHLLDRSGGRTLGSLVALNGDQDFDIMDQQSTAARIETEMDAVRRQTADESQILKSAAALGKSRSSLVREIERHEKVYVQAAAVYRDAAGIVVSRGSQPPPDVEPVNAERQRATAGNQNLVAAIGAKRAVMVRNIEFLRKRGIT